MALAFTSLCFLQINIGVLTYETHPTVLEELSNLFIFSLQSDKFYLKQNPLSLSCLRFEVQQFVQTRS